MITVSNEWKIASAKRFRRQGYLNINLTLEPPGIRANATPTASNTMPISSLASIFDNTLEEKTPYASLELNRWALDGRFDIPTPDTKTHQWWSNDPVNLNPPTVTIEFDKVYSLPGLTIYWDTVHRTYPTLFSLIAYNLSGEVVYNEQIDYTDSYITSIVAPFNDIKRLRLIIHSWSIPTWRARISEIIFGLYISFDSIEDGRIMSATSSDTSDPLCENLPTHTFTLTFRNFDHYFDPTLKEGISHYLAAQQILKANWGFQVDKDTIEQAPNMTYIVQDFDIPADSGSVNINFTNRLALLDGEYIFGTYTGNKRSALAILNEVLNRSGILKESPDQIPWITNTQMADTYTTAPIPAVPINAICQYLAMLSRSWLRIDSETGFIRFDLNQQLPQPYSEISMNQELGDPTVEVVDRLQTINVGVYTYFIDGELKDIGKSEILVNGTLTTPIKYNVSYAVEVTASVSGGTLVSATYYSSYVVVTLQTSSSATVTVNLKGKELKNTVLYLETYNDLVVSDGTNITVDNPFITDVNTAKLVSDRVAEYYNKRTRYTADYIGYPQLEAHDKINFNTTFGDSVVEVVRNNITFNGGWNGTVEVI